MPVTFDGKQLFGVGPQRVSVRPIGQELLPRFRAIPNAPGLQPIGVLDYVVLVSGRLVESSEELLWSLRDEISQELTDPPEPGQLEDGLGRVLGELRFISFATGDRTDRGREVSLEFEATFIAFRHWP